MKIRKSAGVLALLLITSLGLALRTYKLTSSPSGLYIDETSIGYNAYSLITTGRDEHGKFMPLFFEAFGEYKLPVYVYLVAFVQLLIGPTDISVRIPSLIFGTLSIPLIYLFAKELLRGFKVGPVKEFAPIMSAFLLAVSPWHFQFSRPGFEASVGLFSLIGALYLFFRGINNKSTFSISLSLIGFVATLYSYNSARIVTPIIVIILFLLYFKHFEIRYWIKMILVPAILILPFLNFALEPEGLARARQVSVFFQANSSTGQIFSNYLKNISPLYLFKNGDPTIGHLTPYKMPLIYLVEAPFFFAGLAYLIFKQTKISFVIISLFLISQVPPAISTLSPHALRGVFALGTTPVISAIGFSWFLNLFKKNNLYLIATSIFIFAILFSTVSFLNTYHNKYIPSTVWDWQVGTKSTAHKVLEIEDSYSDIYLDWYPITAAWYLKINPVVYQTSKDKTKLGKFHINDDISTEHGLYVGLKPPGGKLLNYVYYPDKSIAYGLWEF